MVTKRWHQAVVDRTADLARIAAALRQLATRTPVVVYVNNHYAGHGPRTCQDVQAALGTGAEAG